MATSRWDEVVTSLLSARPDHATARFDAELAAAEAEGRIDVATARTLRWWQRETVRALEEHARLVIPQVLDSLEAADAAARQAVDDAAAAWALAQPPAASAPLARTADGAVPGSEEHHQATGQHDDPDDGPAGTLGTVTPFPPRPDHPGPGFTSHLAPHAPRAPRAPLPETPAPAGGAPATPGAPVPRLLASGITVLADTPRSGDRPGQDAPAARPEDR
jgi:hypothetical protein